MGLFKSPYHKESTVDKVISYLERRQAQKAEERRRRQEQSKKVILICLLLLAAISAASMGWSQYLQHSAKKASDLEEAKLQHVVEQIQADVAVGNYDEALIKANGLYYTSDYSSDTEKKWDSTREALIGEIEEMKEQDRN